MWDYPTNSFTLAEHTSQLLEFQLSVTQLVMGYCCTLRVYDAICKMRCVISLTLGLRLRSGLGQKFASCACTILKLCSAFCKLIARIDKSRATISPPLTSSVLEVSNANRHKTKAINKGHKCSSLSCRGMIDAVKTLCVKKIKSVDCLPYKLLISLGLPSIKWR